MKIALYYPWIYLTSGAERVLLELSGRSQHRWTLFTNHFDPEHTFPGFADREVVELSPRISVRRTIGDTVRSAIRVGLQKLPLEGYDALVVVCEGMGDMVVFRNRSLPVVNVCLTPLRIVFDPVYRMRYTLHQSRLNKILIEAGSIGFRAASRLAWRRYDRVFCISDECLRRVRAGRLGRSADQEVLHVGAGLEPDGQSRRFDRFFLLPGRIMWTKNIELGVRAFQQFLRERRDAQDFRFVIAGIVDGKSTNYYEHLKDMTAGDPRFEFRIFPHDAELAELYRTCYAVLFTAFNEDWGIVPVEAMAFGKPVIAVNRGGPRESVQHGVQGFLAEPEPGAFAARMAELAVDPELTAAMGQAGLERAKHFSWDRFVSKVDGALELCSGAQRAADPRLSMNVDRATGEEF